MDLTFINLRNDNIPKIRIRQPCEIYMKRFTFGLACFALGKSFPAKSSLLEHFGKKMEKKIKERLLCNFWWRQTILPPNSCFGEIELRSIYPTSIFGNFTKVPSFTISFFSPQLKMTRKNMRQKYNMQTSENMRMNTTKKFTNVSNSIKINIGEQVHVDA